MAVKLVVDKIEDLPEALQEHYAVGTDGKYHLQDDKGPVSTLASAKEHEKNLRVAAERERDEAKGQVTAITGERDTAITERDAAKADKGKDVQALEQSWQQKLADANKAKDDAVAELGSEIQRLLVTNTSQSIAGEISTVPELFSDIISKRLKVEKGADGKFFTRVLDAAGNPSAATIDDLKKELLANEKYAPIVIAGKGSGGGAGGTGSGGGTAEKKWLEYSDTELSELRRTDKDKYDRLKAAHKSAPAAAAS